MTKDTVVKLVQPGSFSDPLTEVLRNGARALLAQAVEAEVGEFLGKHRDLKTEDGLQRIVRHGHLPEREVMRGRYVTLEPLTPAHVPELWQAQTDPETWRYIPVGPFESEAALAEWVAAVSAESDPFIDGGFT